MTRAAFLVHSPRAHALRALNYAPGLESLTRLKKGTCRTDRLSELLSSFGSSYWTVFTRLDCDSDHGVELISQTDMFAAEPEGRTIRRDSMSRPEYHEVKRWQILIAGAGQMAEGNLFSRSIIADGRLEGKFLGPHAVALQFSEAGGLVNLWTYAFLNTAPGLEAIKACAFGTSVPGLRLDLLGELRIPIPLDDSVLRRVANLVRHCVEQRDIYLAELRFARAMIEELPEMKEAHSLCSARKANAVLWDEPLHGTLCAWNYASVGSALQLLQKKWRVRLKDVLHHGGLYRGPRFARISCQSPYGIPLLSQRDAFLARPIPRRIVHPGFADEKLFAPETTIMVGGQGTLGEGEIFGKAMFVHGRFGSTAFTEHLLRMKIRSPHAEVVYAFLSTQVGMRLLRSTAVGTKLLSLREDLLRELPVPPLGTAAEEEIRKRIVRAHVARTSADAAEAEAIRIVEEEALPSWLM
jgi:hypothetical protein